MKGSVALVILLSTIFLLLQFSLAQSADIQQYNVDPRFEGDKQLQYCAKRSGEQGSIDFRSKMFWECVFHRHLRIINTHRDVDVREQLLDALTEEDLARTQEYINSYSTASRALGYEANLKRYQEALAKLNVNVEGLDSDFRCQPSPRLPGAKEPRNCLMLQYFIPKEGVTLELLRYITSRHSRLIRKNNVGKNLFFFKEFKGLYGVKIETEFFIDVAKHLGCWDQDIASRLYIESTVARCMGHKLGVRQIHIDFDDLLARINRISGRLRQKIADERAQELATAGLLPQDQKGEISHAESHALKRFRQLSGFTIGRDKRDRFLIVASERWQHLGGRIGIEVILESVNNQETSEQLAKTILSQVESFGEASFVVQLDPGITDKWVFRLENGRLQHLFNPFRHWRSKEKQVVADFYDGKLTDIGLKDRIELVFSFVVALNSGGALYCDTTYNTVARTRRTTLSGYEQRTVTGIRQGGQSARTISETFHVPIELAEFYDRHVAKRSASGLIYYIGRDSVRNSVEWLQYNFGCESAQLAVFSKRVYELAR